MDGGDAEWVGVDFEFGNPINPGPSTTSRPRPGFPRPLPPMDPATEPPHDAHDEAGSTPTTSFNATVMAGAVGGILGVVLLLLVVYMFVLRRKLSKAKVARGDSEYRLRVEDVAHLTHLDETSNTYVNTTDLQKLVSSVRAKKKAEEKLPLPPRMTQTAPPLVRKPTSPPVDHRLVTGSSGQGDNAGFRGDVDVVTVRPPMPLPHSNPDILQGIPTQVMGGHYPEPVSENIYSNLEPVCPPPSAPPAKKIHRMEPPKIMPPPPPGKKQKKTQSDEATPVTVSPMVIATTDAENGSAPMSPTVIARPAPPPPAGKVPKISQQPKEPPKTQKPTPPVAPKPQRGPDSSVGQKTPPSKPAVPKAAKPGVLGKGRALPPLKMALLHSDSRSSIESCATPDTGILELTPDVDEEKSVASISAKIALLEGKMKTPVLPTRAMPHKT